MDKYNSNRQKICEKKLANIIVGDYKVRTPGSFNFNIPLKLTKYTLAMNLCGAIIADYYAYDDYTMNVNTNIATPRTCPE